MASALETKEHTGKRSESTDNRVAFLTSCEDGFLAVGGFVGTMSSLLTGSFSSFLTAATPTAVYLGEGALVVAALGKAIPSLIATVHYRVRGPIDKLEEKYPSLVRKGKPGDQTPKIDTYELLGDLSLLGLTLAGIIPTLLTVFLGKSTPSTAVVGNDVEWFLIFTGSAFVVKALADLSLTAKVSAMLDKVKKSPADAGLSSQNSRTTEDLLLGALGAIAVVLAFASGSIAASYPGTSTSAAASAAGVLSLGIAAVAKAFPALISAASSSVKPQAAA